MEPAQLARVTRRVHPDDSMAAVTASGSAEGAGKLPGLAAGGTIFLLSTLWHPSTREAVLFGLDKSYFRGHEGKSSFAIDVKEQIWPGVPDSLVAPEDGSPRLHCVFELDSA